DSASAWRAWTDKKSRLQCDHVRIVFDNVRHAPNILAGVAVLARLTIYPTAKRKVVRISNLVGRYQRRAKNEVCVKNFAVAVFDVKVVGIAPAKELAITYRHVVDCGVAEHVIECSIARNATATLANDDTKFRFVVEFFPRPWLVGNIIFGP